jgi:hypothetical protein
MDQPEKRVEMGESYYSAISPFSTEGFWTDIYLRTT